MRELKNQLKKLSADHPIEKYVWKIPESCPIVISPDVKESYNRNVYLKENLKSVIASDKDLTSHYWVINEWGDIGSFKKNERNDDRINKFIDELPKGKLSSASFSCISSLSKVASFIDPCKYAIYDARAIYTLNWLLFNFATDLKLFPHLASRNGELVKYDMQTIFRLTKRELNYHDKKSAFHSYCELIGHLSEEIYGQGSKPYMIEMLLFTAAPDYVVQRIEKTVTLSISADA